MDGVTDLGDEVFEIDTLMGGHAGITAGYLIRSDRPCLVETGTALSAPTVVRALAALGIGPEDLATVVVTHIHLDHAGGVGDIAEAFPRAQVVVHERGARHLVDPTKLVASAHRVFGPVMGELFGDLRPTAAERVVALGDVGTIDLGGGRRLDAFHAPGHASHHVGLLDPSTGDLYTGDAAGVYVPEADELRPATPPPDFDLDLALASMARMRQITPSRLLFARFSSSTSRCMSRSCARASPPSSALPRKTLWPLTSSSSSGPGCRSPSFWVIVDLPGAALVPGRRAPDA